MNKLEIYYNSSPHTVSYADDWIYKQVAMSKTFFEQPLLTELKNKVKSFEVVVDVGSNVGNHSYFFKNICDAGRVYAFEPVHSNYIICKENIPNDDVYQIALSNYVGFTTIENSMGYNSGTGRMVSKEGEVEVSTLDSFKLEGVTFIKIDVEGEELFALEGMEQTIKSFSPEILIEVHYDIKIQDVMEKLPIKYTFEDLGDYHYFLKPY